MHAGEAILQHRQLVDLPELLEDGPKVLLLQVARDLTHEQLHGVVVLHGHRARHALLPVVPHRVPAGVPGRVRVGRGQGEGVAVVGVGLEGEVVVVQDPVLEDGGHAGGGGEGRGRGVGGGVLETRCRGRDDADGLNGAGQRGAGRGRE